MGYYDKNLTAFENISFDVGYSLQDGEFVKVEKRSVPQTITNAQGMAALRLTILPDGKSLYAAILEYIKDAEKKTSGLPESDERRKQADMLRIAWDQTNEWKRQGSTVATISKAFSLSEKDVDGLFILASNLEL